MSTFKWASNYTTNPVFTNKQIAQLKEFGVSKRDACGRTIVFRKA